MTKNVILSITIEIGNDKGQIIKKCIRSEHFEEDLTNITKAVVTKTGEMVLSEYDRSLRREEYKEGKVIRTEERTYELAMWTLNYCPSTIVVQRMGSVGGRGESGRTDSR